MTPGTTSWDLKGRLATIGQILELVVRVRSFDDFASPEGLRQAVDALVELAELVGIDERYVDSVRWLLGDERLLDVLAAIARYVQGWQAEPESEPQASATANGRVREARLDEWLPLVFELLRWIRLLCASLPQKMSIEKDEEAAG